ncbi:unnamed protein product [Protopolystoma xenopodis]|uniref:Uncharacterized protein n=1 Tax=Protopolystoma xenopodis TaxID=117903 RepID=A0A3S5CTC3_9PLAT|nr:unnamed protein product [Protopolystoma xenopodis]
MMPNKYDLQSEKACFSIFDFACSSLGHATSSLLSFGSRKLQKVLFVMPKGPDDVPSCSETKHLETLSPEISWPSDLHPELHGDIVYSQSTSYSSPLDSCSHSLSPRSDGILASGAESIQPGSYGPWRDSCFESRASKFEVGHISGARVEQESSPPVSEWSLLTEPNQALVLDQPRSHLALSNPVSFASLSQVQEESFCDGSGEPSMEDDLGDEEDEEAPSELEVTGDEVRDEGNTSGQSQCEEEEEEVPVLRDFPLPADDSPTDHSLCSSSPSGPSLAISEGIVTNSLQEALSLIDSPPATPATPISHCAPVEIFQSETALTSGEIVTHTSRFPELFLATISTELPTETQEEQLRMDDHVTSPYESHICNSPPVFCECSPNSHFSADTAIASISTSSFVAGQPRASQITLSASGPNSFNSLPLIEGSCELTIGSPGIQSLLLNIGK